MNAGPLVVSQRLSHQNTHHPTGILVEQKQQQQKKTLLRNIVYATQRTQHMLSSLLFLICALRPIILHLQTIQIQSLQLYFSVYFQLSVH